MLKDCMRREETHSTTSNRDAREKLSGVLRYEL
jgi:hypothetical protein